MSDPFGVLGLAASGDLTDDDVRMAWRRVAAATHPDRDDGGDPAAFADAAAAYTVLRTQAGRREALADGRGSVARKHGLGPVSRLTVGNRRVRLALRVLGAVAVCLLVVTAVGWRPASAAVITGALTWLLRAGRNDLT